MGCGSSSTKYAVKEEKKPASPPSVLERDLRPLQKDEVNDGCRFSSMYTCTVILILQKAKLSKYHQTIVATKAIQHFQNFVGIELFQLNSARSGSKFSKNQHGFK